MGQGGPDSVAYHILPLTLILGYLYYHFVPKKRFEAVSRLVGGRNEAGMWLIDWGKLKEDSEMRGTCKGMCDRSPRVAGQTWGGGHLWNRSRHLERDDKMYMGFRSRGRGGGYYRWTLHFYLGLGSWEPDAMMGSRTHLSDHPGS